MGKIITVKISDKPTVYKGGALNIITDRLAAAWKSANEYIKDNPDLVAIEDLESGYPQIMTKEQKKMMLDMWESLKIKSNQEINGKIIMFGTGGQIDNKGWNDFFKNGI